MHIGAFYGHPAVCKLLKACEIEWSHVCFSHGGVVGGRIPISALGCRHLLFAHHTWGRAAHLFFSISLIVYSLRQPFIHFVSPLFTTSALYSLYSLRQPFIIYVGPSPPLTSSTHNPVHPQTRTMLLHPQTGTMLLGARHPCLFASSIH
jgi:hypothetical protein